MKVGVLGGGQLGRMLALAGYPLGMRFRFLDPSPESVARHVAERMTGQFEHLDTLDAFAQGLDVITYEWENVPVTSARHLAHTVPVYPPPDALETAQDRLFEKNLFRRLEIPTPRFAAVQTKDDLHEAVADLGTPAVLKTRRLGYDGKGQYVLSDAGSVETAWGALGGPPLILEEFVSFDRELSLISVRGTDGQTVFYPLVENHHREGILRLSLAPAPNLTPAMQSLAEIYAERILTALDYVGVLAIEFFARQETLLANETAPRVHNSGHWTTEGAETSQFENHLRAIAGLPLGATHPIGRSAMFNLIGQTPDTAQVLTIPEAHLHLYDKKARSGRKLGHITLRSLDAAHYDDGIGRLRALLDMR